MPVNPKRLPLPLKKLHRKIKQIDGIALVNVRWVKEYIGKDKYESFNRTHASHIFRRYKPCGPCPKCGRDHFSNEFTTWVSFWALESYLSQGELPLTKVIPEEATTSSKTRYFHQKKKK